MRSARCDDFRKKFPASPYMKKAEEIRREVLKRLVDHEVYVARFYLKSDHPKAAALRLEGAIRRYPGSGREPELLYSLGETYLHMCDPQRAKETFARVVAEYGAAPQARRSELYLQHIAAALRRRTALQDAAAHRRAGPGPRPAPAGNATQWLTASGPACASWSRAGARTTRTANTPRRPPASPRCCARRRPTPTSTTCWASSITRRGAWPTPRRCSTRRCASTRRTPRRR